MNNIEALLDASAILAWFQEEPGAEVVDAVMNKSALCAVTAAEIVNKLIRTAKMPPADALAAVDQLNIPIIPFTDAMFTHCAELSTHNGLSLGDRLCLAAAKEMAIPVYTADQRWASLPFENIRLIREWTKKTSG